MARISLTHPLLDNATHSPPPPMACSPFLPPLPPSLTPPSPLPLPYLSLSLPPPFYLAPTTPAHALGRHLLALRRTHSCGSAMLAHRVVLRRSAAVSAAENVPQLFAVLGTLVQGLTDVPATTVGLHCDVAVSCCATPSEAWRSARLWTSVLLTLVSALVQIQRTCCQTLHGLCTLWLPDGTSLFESSNVLL
jgi:hypothetical protein